jgi:UDP-N-acetylglucosamine--N-acetylmuramyl-(pentapeptide) pyrophosphoryl-undecaprenol N-acetylglucosamine transferase
VKVIFAGGGTAGHVYPGLSVAEALRTLRPDARVIYAGTGDAEEERIVRAAGLRYTRVPATGVRGRSPVRAAKSMATIAAGTERAVRLLAHLAPDAVFATGGYGSVPVALAAGIRRIPLVLFLPDVYPGWAVRFSARWATALATTTEAALEFLPFGKTRVTGYPVRRAFFDIDRQRAREQTGLPPRVPVLLITGGSSGAVSLNSAFARHLPQFTTLAHVVHLTGRRDESRMLDYRSRLTEQQQSRYRVRAYADDMPALMASADLAITRAGASTLGELPAVGLPAVMVPLQQVSSDQIRNARFLESQGAAVTIESEEAADQLYAAVQGIFTEPERLATMRRAMTGLARPEAARDIARLIVESADIGVAADDQAAVGGAP